MADRVTGTIVATGYTDLSIGRSGLIGFPKNWLSAGTSDWKRGTPATAPNVPGRVLTDHSLDVVTFTATLRLGAEDGSTNTVTIINTLGDLINRVRVNGWHFTFAYDSATFEWACEPAAVAPQFDRMFLDGFMLVTLTVPRNPIPVQGPF